MHRPRSLAPLLLVVLGVLLTLPSGALAAKPVFHEKIDDTILGVDFCGVAGVVHVTGTQVGFETGTSIKTSGQVTAVFTSDDGRTVTLKSAGTVVNSFTKNSDGSVTVVGTFKGLSEKLSGTNGRPELLNAGLISFVTTFDAAGNVISSDIVVVHGPHPDGVNSNPPCSAFLAALG